MSYILKIGESFFSQEDQDWWVKNMALDGAPWFTDHNGCGVNSENNIMLSNEATRNFIASVRDYLPEISGASIVHITPSFVQRANALLAITQQKFNMRMTSYYTWDTMELSMICWLAWWSDRAMRKCVQPILIIF